MGKVNCRLKRNRGKAVCRRRIRRKKTYAYPPKLRYAIRISPPTPSGKRTVDYSYTKELARKRAKEVEKTFGGKAKIIKLKRPF